MTLTFLDDMRPLVCQRANPETRSRSCDRSQLHLFDTLHHAVALEEVATFVTADVAYFNNEPGAIQLLADFQT
jgi:hypothetical protein